MVFLQCFTGAPIPPIGDDVAYDLGKIANLSMEADIPVDTLASPSTVPNPLASLLITNPLADPAIVHVSVRLPYISVNDPSEYGGWVRAERIVAVAIDASIVLTNLEQENFELYPDSVSGSTADFDTIAATFVTELAGGASVTALIQDQVRAVSDGVSPPATVQLNGGTGVIGDSGWVIEATGWLKQP